jgi:hypothetical protein
VSEWPSIASGLGIRVRWYSLAETVFKRQV